MLLALGLMARALIPGGVMVSAAGDHILTVTICSGAGDMPGEMQIAVPNRRDSGGGQPEPENKPQPCAFSGLGQAALAGADAVLLAAALLFILLTGRAPHPSVPVRDLAHLRPPLRGPPVPTV
ncbi:hypothetical protein EYB45_05450 [Erythrobacteraceae bacterium CFH 75059]|nr:hypothetical protein EYB45_05450 [Erythrobacteraceae bacterium CFH 75059]